MPKLGVVVFGASIYDNQRELNNSRFANSAKQFIETISNPDVIPDCSVKSLDLYNQPDLPSETLVKITDFVSEDFDDVIIYYCGHGDVSRKVGEYRVFLRKSKRNLRHATMLDVIGLIRDVERISSEKTVYFVLDACYSGSVINQEFMDAGGAEVLIDRSLSEVITQRGIAVFAATSGLDPALAKKGDKLSLFTGAFIRCLSEGIPYKRDLEKLSWLEVRDEIARATRDRLGPDAPVPKITSLDERFGDVTRTPFFLNRAYTPSKMPSITTEELYWKNLPDDAPLSVLHDFLAKFPEGIFAPLARALANKQIGRVTEAELEEFLRYHPKTKFRQEVAARLVVLKRDRIQKSTDVAALERIIAEDPSNELAGEVKQRIDSIRREAEESEAWERVKVSSNAGELEQFLKNYPDGKFSKLARERLEELTARLDTSQKSTHVNWLRYAAVAALLVAVGAGALFSMERKSADRSETLRAELVAAGDDPVRLRTFISQCETASCPFSREAKDRLAKVEQARSRQVAETQRRALAAVPNDVAGLSAFVDKCRRESCLVLDDANGRLAAAQATVRAAEATRQRKEADSKALAAVPNDVASLSAFVDKCRRESCLILDDANGRLAAAQATARTAEATRQRKETDSKALAAVPNNVASLSAFVDKCKKDSCLMSEEASSRLAVVQAEADRHAKAASLGFNTFFNYDIDKNDIDDGKIFNTNAPSCSEKCQSINECVAFVFDKWNSACYLKNQVGLLTQTPRSNTFVRTDMRPIVATTKPRTCPYNDSSMHGDVSKSLSAPSTDACKQKCEAETGCIAYTFRKADRQCTFFSSVSDRTRNDPTSNSGERTQNPC